MSKKISIGNIYSSFTKLVAGLVLVAISVNPLLAGDPVRVVLEPDDLHNVQIQAEYNGTVVVRHRATEEEQELETTLPIQVRALLKFEQQVLSKRHSIRNYQTATSDITIDEKQRQTGLEKYNRTLGVYLGESRTAFPKPILYSSEIDILEQSELELISTPFDYVCLLYTSDAADE